MKRLPFQQQGLNFDEYVKSFGKRVNDKLRIQAFGELLKKIKAVSAAILIKKENKYVIDLSIGMSEESISSFSFSLNNKFISSYFEPKNVVIIKVPVAGVNILKKRLFKDDTQYLKNALLIPAVYRNQDAYLFLGFSKKKQKEIQEQLNLMNAYVA